MVKHKAHDQWNKRKQRHAKIVAKNNEIFRNTNSVTIFIDFLSKQRQWRGNGFWTRGFLIEKIIYTRAKKLPSMCRSRILRWKRGLKHFLVISSELGCSAPSRGGKRSEASVWRFCDLAILRSRHISAKILYKISQTCSLSHVKYLHVAF